MQKKKKRHGEEICKRLDFLVFSAKDRLRLLNSTAFLVEVKTKLPTKRKVQA